MSPPRHASAPLVGAADVGGTWLRVGVSDGRRTWRVRRRGSGLPEIASSLHSALRTARGRGPLAALVVAARGVWTPRERTTTRRALRGLARRVAVISDAEAAWHAALGDGAGVLVLAGTGSIALGRDARGRWARAGGLGPLLGDEGSAFWLGREWLRRADVARARRLARRSDAVRRIAALAPRVLARARAGDRAAAAVVRTGQASLAALAADVARALALRAPVSLGWAGGVMEDRAYRAGVARALARRGIAARWTRRERDPLDAALGLAARIAGAPRALNGRRAAAGRPRRAGR